MTDELKARPGTDAGIQRDIDGNGHHYETKPSAIVKAILEQRERHKAIKATMGTGYYVFISDICCNPFRRNDWHRDFIRK